MSGASRWLDACASCGPEPRSASSAPSAARSSAPTQTAVFLSLVSIDPPLIPLLVDVVRARLPIGSAVLADWGNPQSASTGPPPGRALRAGLRIRETVRRVGDVREGTHGPGVARVHAVA